MVGLLTFRRTTVLFALGCALLSSSCGDDEPFYGDGGQGRCNSQTCTGCCLGDECQAGDDPSTCGRGGLACIRCEAGDRCIEGQCLLEPSACNADSCPDGCCREGKCVPGADDGACGNAGQLCMACGTTSSCREQRCLCAADRCPGCCDEGICRAGTNTNACGGGGDECVRCSATEFCSDGACVPLAGCSPSNCVGCCDGERCLDGLEQQACGKGGESCRPCSGAAHCNAGVCNDPALCGPGNCRGCCTNSACITGATEAQCGRDGALCVSCAAAQVCNALSGACELDLARPWGLTVVSARIATDKDWDLFFATAPDPFVRITVADFAGETRTAQDTYEPSWDEELGEVVAGVLLGLQLEIEVRDADAVGSELIGACKVELSANILLAGQRTVDGCGSGGQVLELVLAFTPH